MRKQRKLSDKIKVSADLSKKDKSLSDMVDDKMKKDLTHARYAKTFTNDKDKPYKGPNDINWRIGTRLSVSAANVSFGQPSGLRMRITESESKSYPEFIGGMESNMTIPGVLAVALQITAGTAKDYNSPINLAVRKSYSWIRHANSGSKNYENSDLGLYYIAVGQALALLGYLKRMYVHALNYSATNRYLPKAILTACGVNATDIVDHLPQLLFLINWLSSTINSLAFPKFAYFDMCYRQFMNVYRDSESPKEQFYIFVPQCFGIYNPTLTKSGGGVEYDKDGSSPSNFTFSQLSALVHSVMDVLLSDEDIGIISGDILKAYGEDRFKVDFTDVKEILEPMYSIEVLEQIHNLTQTSGAVIKDYHQLPGDASQAPYITENIVGSTFKATGTDFMLPSGAAVVIDAMSRDPDYKEVVNCSILKSHLEYSFSTNAGEGASTGIQHECLVVRSIKLYTEPTSLGDIIPLGASSEWFINLANTHLSDVYIKLTNFDWSPMLFCFDTDKETVSVLGDINNVTTIDSDALARIHEASVLSLFNFESGNF